MWKDKKGNDVNILDTVSFCKDGMILQGNVVAVMDNDHLLTIKVDRCKYFDVLDSECELIAKGNLSNFQH